MNWIADGFFSGESADALLASIDEQNDRDWDCRPCPACGEMLDRYRATLTLADGTLLTCETFSESALLIWVERQRQKADFKGLLVERIITIVIE